MRNVVALVADADSAVAAGIVTAIPGPFAVSEQRGPVVLIAVVVAASAAVAVPTAAVFAALLAVVFVAQVAAAAAAQVAVAVAARVAVVVAGQAAAVAAPRVAVAAAAQAVPAVVVVAQVVAAASVVAVEATGVAAETQMAVEQVDEYPSDHPERIQCADLAGLLGVPASAFDSPPVQAFGMTVVRLPRRGLVLLGPVSQV